MGEHRLMPGKKTAYDSDIHVPLIVTGPSIRGGTTVEDIAENIDLCPTFAELAGMTPSAEIDGRSLVPLLHGQTLADWRAVALIEHHGTNREAADPDRPSARSGNPPSYEALRSRSFLYVEYADGEKEYHDFASDPDELHNTFASLPDATRAALTAMLGAGRCLPRRGELPPGRSRRPRPPRLAVMDDEPAPRPRSRLRIAPPDV
jgi:arylsulfatase A-like enzyme